jgi:hypothetical protein
MGGLAATHKLPYRAKGAARSGPGHSERAHLAGGVSPQKLAEPSTTSWRAIRCGKTSYGPERAAAFAPLLASPYAMTLCCAHLHSHFRQTTVGLKIQALDGLAIGVTPPIILAG